MLEIKDLRVAYGAIQAVDGMELTVGRGETVSLVGANGAGKSSLLRAITGLVKATGSVRLEGEHELIGRAAHKIASLGIRSVPEGGSVFNAMTVRENLLIGYEEGPATRDHAEALDEVHTLFPKLRDRMDQVAGTLSGGERQMLAIARALLGEPKLLLLDEPSFGLAPIVVDEIFEKLGALMSTGLTLLLIEQNARRALAVAERAYVVEQGRVVASGQSEAILDDAKIVEAYLG